MSFINGNIENIAATFEGMETREQDLLLKQLLLKCTSKQLQMLHNDTRQLLAVDFVTLLPREIVDRIFSYLTPVELSRAACCSCQWRERSNNNGLWKNLCKRRGWSHFGDSTDSKRSSQELYLVTPPVIQNSNLNSPTFKPFVSKDLPMIGQWKDIYVRADHLNKNWSRGRYVVMPPVHFHNDIITCADMDGCILATGSLDRTVALVDVSTGKLLNGFRHHDAGITCLKVRGNVLFTGSSDGTVRIYNVSTGKCLSLIEQVVLREHSSPVKHLCSNGTFAFVSYEDRTVCGYNMVSKRCMNRINAHTDDIVEMMCNRRYLITTSWDGTARVWNVEDGEIKGVHHLRGHTEVIHCCLFNDQYVVSGGGDKVVKIWQMATGECLQTLYGHSDDIYCLDFNEKYIASGSADSTVRIWNWLGICLHVLSKHVGVVRSVKIRRDMIISSGDQKRVVVWNIDSGNMLNMVHRNPSLVKFMLVNDTKLVVISPDSPGLVTILSYW